MLLLYNYAIFTPTTITPMIEYLYKHFIFISWSLSFCVSVFMLNVLTPIGHHGYHSWCLKSRSLCDDGEVPPARPVAKMGYKWNKWLVCCCHKGRETGELPSLNQFRVNQVVHPVPRKNDRALSLDRSQYKSDLEPGGFQHPTTRLHCSTQDPFADLMTAVVAEAHSKALKGISGPPNKYLCWWRAQEHQTLESKKAKNNCAQ